MTETLMERVSLAMDLIQHHHILHELMINEHESVDTVASIVMIESTLKGICKWVSRFTLLYISNI